MIYNASTTCNSDISIIKRIPMVTRLTVPLIYLYLASEEIWYQAPKEHDRLSV